MKKSFFFCLLMLSVSVFADPESLSFFEERFLKDSAGLLKAIRQELPGMVESLDDKAVQRSLTAFLNAAGIQIFTAPQVNGPRPAKGSVIYKGIILNGGSLYLRMDSFCKQTFQQLKADLKKNRNARGIIIDLRNCSTGNEPFETFSPITLNMPAVLLISPKTAGTGELFARKLSETKQCILMGEPTAGTPCPLKSFQYAGKTFYVPAMPAGFIDRRYGKTYPAIYEKAAPQSDFSVLQKNKTPANSDTPLRRAKDLLTALEAIRKGK